MNKTLDEPSVALESIYKEMDSLKYLSLSNESISETILRLIRRLINALGTIISDLSDNGLLALKLSSLNTGIEELLTTTRTSTLSGNQDKFKVNARLSGLMFRNQPVTTVQTLVNQLKALTVITTKYGVYQETLTNNPEINNLTKVNNEKLLGLLRPYSPTSKLLDSSFTRSSDAGDWLSKDLLGGKRLKITASNNVNYIQDTNISFVNSVEMSKSLPREIHFERFPSTYQISLLNAAKELVSKLNLHYGTQARYKRINALKVLQNHLKVVELKASKADPETETQLRENMVLLGTYIKWLTGSYLEMIQLNIRVVNSALNVCRQNLNPMKED